LKRRAELLERLKGYPGKEDFERLGKAAESLREIQDQKIALSRSIREAEGLKAAGVSIGILGSVTGFLGALLSVIGYARGLAYWPYILVLSILIILVSALWLFLRLRKTRGRSNALFDLNEDFEKLDRMEKDSLDIFRRDSAAEALKMWDELERGYQKLNSELEQVDVRIRDMAGRADEGEIQSRMSDLSAQKRSLEIEMTKLEPYLIKDGQELLNKEKELDDKKKKLNDLEVRKGVLAESIKKLSDDSKDLVSLKEELQEVESQLAYWRQRARALEFALEGLSEARTRVISDAGPFLKERVEPLISRITSGRYSRINIEEGKKGLEFNVMSDEKGDWAAEDELSQATKEQLYLSARLALIELIAAGKKPVILLDDPFAHFDDERLKACLDILKEWSNTFQMIIFAPTSRYSSAADQVIALK
jgi:exonuclease SbcC